MCILGHCEEGGTIGKQGIADLLGEGDATSATRVQDRADSMTGMGNERFSQGGGRRLAVID